MRLLCNTCFVAKSPDFLIVPVGRMADKASHVIALELNAIFVKFSVPDRFIDFLRTNGVTTIDKLAYLTAEEKTVLNDIIEPSASDPA